MSQIPVLAGVLCIYILLAGCDSRQRYDASDSSLPFANSLEEAIRTCKAEAQKNLDKDRDDLSRYGVTLYHSDKEAIREVVSIPCDTNYVDDDTVSEARGLDLGEICLVSSNATMRVVRLIPDQKSVDDPNWNKPKIDDALALGVVMYPCKNGNGCEKVLVSDPVRWVIRDPTKCSLPADSLEPK
jgi:hypothetical protein